MAICRGITLCVDSGDASKSAKLLSCKREENATGSGEGGSVGLGEANFLPVCRQENSQVVRLPFL
ncbi:MAG: hypothetical protein EOM05_11915 [Clostridia bacterium]|nr:hypothetical protein [Clostridia bacterium]